MAIVEFKDVSRVYVSGDRTLEAGKASSFSIIIRYFLLQ